MSLDTIVFFVSAVVAVFGGTMMILQRNPVASVLYLILSLVAQAVLYVQLGSVFMGAVLIIVYAGAILVLFLFVIMLLNLRGREDLTDHSKPISRWTKYIVSALLLVEFSFVIRSGFFAERLGGVMQETAKSFGSVHEIAMALFTRYLYPFELTSILIVAAIVGAVVMARRERGREAVPPDSNLPRPETQVSDRVNR
ncbi:MAG: NADH-quinone oxidoreductase subunit J [Candidatus Zixiibacteriota bacterium]